MNGLRAGVWLILHPADWRTIEGEQGWQPLRVRVLTVHRGGGRYPNGQHVTVEIDIPASRDEPAARGWIQVRAASIAHAVEQP